jgi:CHASE3 domain sensor protein
MKMKAALKIIALIPLFLSLIIILAVFWATREMKASREMNRSAERIVENAFELNVITDQYLLYPGERPKIQFRSIHNSMKRALEKIKTKTTEEEDLLKDVRQNHESVGSLFDLLVSIHERPTEVPSVELRETVMGQLLASSREIVSDSFELSRINLVRMDAVQGGVISFLLIVAFISGIGFASYSFLLGRRIERTNEDLHRQITERKRAEETLAKNATSLRLCWKIPELSCRSRQKRADHSLNRTCEVITGYTSKRRRIVSFGNSWCRRMNSLA